MYLLADWLSYKLCLNSYTFLIDQNSYKDFTLQHTAWQVPREIEKWERSEKEKNKKWSEKCLKIQKEWR